MMNYSDIPGRGQFLGVWAARRYEIGDIVLYAGWYFRCVGSTPSGKSPEKDTTNWEIIKGQFDSHGGKDVPDEVIRMHEQEEE